ncbi:MAG TPA: Gfo/Idh/MocA family oxidoreductase [bacterium]|nr:Gfo/Idh/MocA family oxidoreductase [bacterium]
MNALRAGLSGAGPAGLGVVHDCRAQHDCDVVAVHDDRPGAAQTLADGSGLGFATDSFDALLAYGVDFVILTGPLDKRLEQVRRAAEQAVPCLLHAPFAPDLASARAIAEIGERNQLRIGVWVAGQADPVVEQLRRMIAADWLGGVVCVQSLVGDDELLRTGETATSGDPFVTLAAEHLHLATWLTGRRAVSVCAQTTRSFAPGIDDGGAATVVLRGSLPCTYLTSRLCRARTFAIHGTDGGLRLADDRIWLAGQRAFQGHVFGYETPGIEQELARSELEPALRAHRPQSELHGRFARWLDDTDDFPCPVEQAVLDFEVLDAMRRAASTGETVALR